jgi:hypothetical protein
LLKKAFLYLLFSLAISGIAQTRKRTFAQRELGFYGGASYYIGDINPRGHFLASHPAGGIFFRYAKSYRYAFRFGFNYGQISGNDADSKEPDQRERNLNFKTNIYELNGTAEFNFVEYRIGNDRYKFTLFVFAGFAGFYFNPQANINGQYVPLREQRTEGEEKPYPRFQVSIPFGLGLKWNIGDKCGLGIEWGPRRTFTDYLDDVKGSYPASFSESSGINYTDRTLNHSATPGSMRGNPSTKDWYFFYGITLNVKLPDPRKTCHGAGKKARSN